MTDGTRPRPRLVCFPGLGCDARMLGPQQGIDADLDVQSWIEPLAGEPLAAYARRMAARIDRSTPFHLLGISLGAMVAQEVATLLPSRGLILLAGCRSNRGVPISSRLACRCVVAGPGWLVHLGKTVVPHMRQLFGIAEASEVDLFEAMMADADDELIRWSLRAVLDWPGAGRIDVPTLQVHAERDRVLPLRLAGSVDIVIPAAGHAVTVTHPAAVNAAVNHWLSERPEG